MAVHWVNGSTVQLFARLQGGANFMTLFVLLQEPCTCTIAATHGHNNEPILGPKEDQVLDNEEGASRVF